MSIEAKSDIPTCVECDYAPVVVRDYRVEMGHDGRTYTVTVPQVELLRCEVCGAELIGEEADAAMYAALRAQLGLLQPDDIRDRRLALGLTQPALAACLSIAIGTLSRWEKGHQIQQKAMDQYLRTFFEVPEARRYLGAPDACWIDAISKAPDLAELQPIGPARDYGQGKQFNFFGWWDAQAREAIWDAQAREAIVQQAPPPSTTATGGSTAPYIKATYRPWTTPTQASWPLVAAESDGRNRPHNLRLAG